MADVRFFDGPDTARRARDAFDGAELTSDRLTERLGEHAFAHLGSGELAPLLHATSGGDRLDHLLRLFVLGTPVPRDAARDALGPLPLETWLSGNVIEADAHDVRARIAIRPVPGLERWLVAHDLVGASGRQIARDHVLGLSASTMALAGSTIRRPIGSAFDLATGCGIQALHASAHADRVVASDLNPRALALAKLTMELNGVENIDFRVGDRFEPVADETFDLVVANPPFVISPSHRYLFRDAGLPTDELCRSIVRSAADHLAEGGHAVILASWAHVAGQDWRQRLAGWFSRTGCDALVLEREAVDPAAHAASWLRQTEPPDRWDPEYGEWMAYDEQHGIEAIGFGLIAMRLRGSGTAWFRAEEAPQDFAMPCGDHLGAVFELADFLDAHPGDTLLGATLRVAPDVVLDERARPTPDGWSPSDRRLRQTAGLRFDGEVDAGMAAIVTACDGQRPLAAILAEVAASVGVDRGRVEEAAMPVIRRLVQQGFLLPG
jgi:hypothetical protein